MTLKIGKYQKLQFNYCGFCILQKYLTKLHIVVCTRRKRAPAKEHAVLLEKIENGNVFLRDPLPLNQGSSYSISIEDFNKIFNDKAVIIKN